MQAGRIRQFSLFEQDAFGGEKPEFSVDLRASFFALKAARGEVRGDDAMAGDAGSEGVPAERLAYSSAGCAANAGCHGLVGCHTSARDALHGVVDTHLEVSGVGVRRIAHFLRKTAWWGRPE